MKKALWVVGGLIVVLIIIGASAGTPPPKEQSNQSQNTSQPAQSKFDVQAFYSQVQAGQNKQQVVELAGKDPDGCTESQTSGFGAYEICNWNAPLGQSTFATIQFKDGVVESKTKTGF